MFNQAEEVVRCWHYEDGFFTLQNRKVGLKEIDMLAINPHTQEKRHVEVKVDPQLIVEEFEKHSIKVVYFDDLVTELRKKLGQRRSSDTAGLFVQLLRMA